MMMTRILDVARRDLWATVGNKGFLIGLLIMPLLITMAVIVAPRFLNSPSPQVRGEVAVIDLSGEVTRELRLTLDPERIAARRAEDAKRAGTKPTPRQNADARASVPVLTLIERPATADVANEKSWLIQEQDATTRHFALIVIKRDAAVRAAGNTEYGTYDLYTSRALNDRTEQTLHEAIRQALVTARLKGKGLDQAELETSMRVMRPNPVIVAAAGEQEARRGVTRMLPFISGLLLFIGVFGGGQALLASMIEEKSSRVVEVLLAAVSPLELMWGKLIAQLGVCLLTLGVYCALGLLSLASIAVIDPMLLVYLAAFFVIGYLIFGALMLAIGAAASQLADTQGLMGPLLIIMLAPYMLTPMIGQSPNSPLSVTLSFIPPLNVFTMMARIASDSPPPAWQVVLTIAAGLAFAAGVLWFAAKVFRIGLLMHGKPPSIGTMIRWARMA